MPLFTGQRDISLFRQLNQELINKIIRTEILFYKLIMDESDTNVYGEGINKTYYAGVKIPCIITREDQEYAEESFGIDLQQRATFAFLRHEFLDLPSHAQDFVPEVGDLIEWDKAYFEIDTLVENQIVGGKDPDYSRAGTEWGNSHSIVCNCHMTRMSRIQIEDPRYGNSETTKYDYPRNI